MPERWSKAIAVAECILILAPLSIQALWGWLPLGAIGLGEIAMSVTPMTRSSPDVSVLSGIALLINTGLLVCSQAIGWYMIYCFLFGGARRLQTLRPLFWLVPAFGAIVLVIAWYIHRFIDVDDRVGVLGSFEVFGERPAFIVALIPLFHMWLERKLRTNNRIERPREP